MFLQIIVSFKYQNLCFLRPQSSLIKNKKKLTQSISVSRGQYPGFQQARLIYISTSYCLYPLEGSGRKVSSINEKNKVKLYSRKVNIICSQVKEDSVHSNDRRVCRFPQRQSNAHQVQSIDNEKARPSKSLVGHTVCIWEWPLSCGHNGNGQSIHFMCVVREQSLCNNFIVFPGNNVKGFHNW